MERSYYGKEVNLAVMLCLVEKKTCLLCVSYVCVRVCQSALLSRFLSPRMCMTHHLPLHHHIIKCALLFVCLVENYDSGWLYNLKASSVVTECAEEHRRQ